MSEEKLLAAFGQIDEKLIEEADPEKKQSDNQSRNKKTVWWKWAAVAACVCLMVGLGTQLLRDKQGEKGGSSGNESGTVFMSYAGPVFPLHSLTDTSGITAERNIDYDFSPYIPVTITAEADGEKQSHYRYQTESIVIDSYVLSNQTDNDVTLSMVYPFVSNFREGYQYLPAISIGGSEVETELYAGKFSGYFYSAHGRGSSAADKSNISGQQQWQAFQTLLEDGQYLADALAPYPELNQKVIVYKINNIVYDGNDKKATNPTLGFEFTIDEENTIVFPYGSRGGRRDSRTGEWLQSYDIPEDGREPEDCYLLVLGNDIRDVAVQGYRDGGCDKGEEITGVTADVERYESTLGEMVWQLLFEENKIKYWEEEEEYWDIASDEMVFGSLAELLYDYGVLAENPAERYDWGHLEDMWSETYHMERVLYVAFSVTVPANSSISVEASMLKDASFDYSGHGTDRNGYDLVTTLGSSLAFSVQTASVSNTEAIEIVYQNFGFHPAEGINKVTLDVKEPHYHMEIRRVQEENSDE